MAKKDIEIGSTLMGDLTELGNQIAKKIATKSRDNLYNTYKQIMYDFYDDYTPKIYKRTNAMRDLSYKKFYRNSHGNIFFGNVQLTYEKIPPDNYRHVTSKGKIWGLPNSAVFEMVTYHGLHGLAHTTKPSPYEQIVKANAELPSRFELDGREIIDEVMKENNFCFDFR